MHFNYLKESFFIDYGSPEIQNLVSDLKNLKSEKDKIEQLYLKVRYGCRYSTFVIGLTDDHYVASNIYRKKEAHCIDKAILLIAGLRGLNMPARLHLAKVSNHIATESLEAQLGTNELAPHRLVDVYFNGEWTKCSPAFNRELCDKYNVDVLDSDGTEDSVLQEYNRDNNKFMEYLDDYGHFEDVPLDEIKSIFKSNYPEMYERFKSQQEIDFNS